MAMQGVDLEIHKKKVFTFAMKGKWKDVIEMYEKDPRLHQAKITRSEDTALHIAVSDGNEEVVAQMVGIVCSTSLPRQHRIDALQTQNERKNTALHIAASMGNVRMCELIGNVDPSLVDIRNVDGETPLFLAALHGRKQAFLCLHYIRNPPAPGPGPDNTSTHYCRRNGGDTILHCAIAGDYFDLAFQIINLYGDIVNSVNEMGLSPLHLLAAKPSAFRSGSRLGRFQMIIYYCILVEELEVEHYDPKKGLTANQRRKSRELPKNYQTCWDLFSVIKTALNVATDKFPLAHYLKNKFAPRGGQPHSKADDLEEAKNIGGSKARAEGRWLYPPNYRTCCNFVKFLYLAVMVFLGQGSTELMKIKRKKEQHTWSVQIMNELLSHASLYEYDDDGSIPEASAFPSDKDATTPYTIDESGNITRHSTSTPQNQSQQDKDSGKSKIETPILIAAKNGVTEMVEKILELFPVAIHDMNEEKKNIVLLAVENRQPHVYELLVKRNILKESLFRKVDNEGNSALHLAAKLGDYKPWLIPGAALQMQWEIKWYQFVKESMPPHFYVRYNNYNKTPRDIFTETHKELVKSGGEWLSKTSESCSLVAALIATVAFATSATVPGGMDEKTGHPILEKQPAFNLFAISSLIALCCSITAVVVFLSILTSRFQEYDFGRDLPRKLLCGLTSLFMSIVSMLVSFCGGHFFVLQDQLQYAALPIYAVTSLPVTLFALAQFPLYFDLVWATFKHVPQRSYKVIPSPFTPHSSSSFKMVNNGQNK